MNEPTPSANVLERLEQAEQLKLHRQYDQALSILEQLIIEDPDNVSALEEIADNELSLGKMQRAETAARQAIELDDESYTGHYILGFLLSHKQVWDEAMCHLKRANFLKPNNPEILRCLGWALFNANQRAQGVVTLERSLNLDTENTLTLCDLGVSYLQVKNFPKAKALFQRAFDLDPENPRVQECAQTIKRLETTLRGGK